MSGDNAGLAVLVLAAGAAALLYSQSSSANVAPTDTSSSTDLGFSDLLDSASGAWSDLNGTVNTMLGTADNPNYNGYDANLSAFLYMLRMAESNNRYNVINGGRTFSDYSRHPDIGVPIPWRPGKVSTAAGAYQFIFGTWNQVAAEAGLYDFTPASQDAGAVQYLSDLGALPYIEAGDLNGAYAQINATGVIFESLPNAQGHNRSPSQLQAWYQAAGGALA
ncbi:glycoside hydrolase family 104 protein [Burkholderia sp. Ac-20345]|uniref:glycoside hydrolase family 24 protein n=1 Tax=Burkholderia sp. Ac-20345 TaxID=2703891 RepID=UPI00197C4324|nr:glycoside hydrolase family 104 protein [Burkholderia sp. Ac-20345]MBN3781153.1 glycoside hydrolase family 104 protein [Burkholderia sp. Ac-20345]